VRGAREVRTPGARGAQGAASVQRAPATGEARGADAVMREAVQRTQVRAVSWVRTTGTRTVRRADAVMREAGQWTPAHAGRERQACAVQKRA
jgi:hypothetical protein